MKALQPILQNKIFRYFVSAGLATWVDITVYFLAYNYLYQKMDFEVFDAYTISAATASLCSCRDVPGSGFGYTSRL